MESSPPHGFSIGFHRDRHRDLVLGSTTSFPFTGATDVGFIHLHLGGQFESAKRSHCLANLLEKKPCAFIGTYPQLSLEFHRGQPLLGGSNQVHSPDENGEWVMEFMEYRSRSDGRLALTVLALKQTALAEKIMFNPPQTGHPNPFGQWRFFKYSKQASSDEKRF